MLRSEVAKFAILLCQASLSPTNKSLTWLNNSPAIEAMTDTTQLRQQLDAELDDLSPEHLFQVLELARQLRQTDDLKPARECFEQGWKEAMSGETFPIEQLWDDIEDG